MKRILYMAVPIAISLSGCAAWVQTTYQPSPQPVYTNNPPPDYNNNSGYSDGYPAYDDSPQTDQVFYDELSPYGQWVDYPDYGYVWAPNAGPDFRPYATNGYWTYSDYGWTWVSNYNWGWAPFHYGRWFYDNNYGWMWMPGHEWAPAWVTWGSYGDYYCWAPIAPRIDVRSNGGWTPPENSWNVVQRRRINQVNVNTYIVRTNAAVIRNVVIINNINTNERVGGSKVNRRDPVYNRGPRINDVENVTNSRIQPVRINDNRKPGAQVVTNNQLNVYRPEIKQNLPIGIARPAPRKVETKPNAPNNPQQNQPNKPDVNREPAQNQNPKPTRPQQNQPQQQQPNNRPDNNQTQPNQNPRPNNQPQQQQPNNRPDNNQNQPQPNQNPRPNNQPQQQQPNNRPDSNQPQPNQNPRPNNQPQQQQPNKPDVNRDPAQRQNIAPNNQQVNPTPAKKPINFFGLKRPVQQPVKKTDTVRRPPNRQ